jgi:hypothetical protein
MTRWIAALVALALAGAALYFYVHSTKPEPATVAPAATTSAPPGQTITAVSRAIPKTNSLPATVLTASPASNTPSAEPPSTPPPGVSGALFFGGPQSAPVVIAPETVMENTRAAIRNYGSRFGGNPVGTNPEITATLNGDNPGEVKFLDPAMGMRVNGKAELVDPWGTPFFFHQLSGTEMEIRSAGPDKQMWTPDDLVIK